MEAVEDGFRFLGSVVKLSGSASLPEKPSPTQHLWGVEALGPSVLSFSLL